MRLLKIHTPEHSPTFKESKSLKESPEYMQYFKAFQVLLMIKQIWGFQLNWNRFDVGGGGKNNTKMPKNHRERSLLYPPKQHKDYFLRDFLMSGVQIQRQHNNQQLVSSLNIHKHTNVNIFKHCLKNFKEGTSQKLQKKKKKESQIQQ